MADTAWLMAAAGLACLGLVLGLWQRRQQRRGFARSDQSPAEGARAASAWLPGPPEESQALRSPRAWAGAAAADREELLRRLGWLEDWHRRRTHREEETLAAVRALSEDAQRCSELAGNHQELQALLDGMQDRLRRVERELRRNHTLLGSLPPRIDDLRQALETLAEAVRHSSGMAVEVRIHESVDRHRPARRIHPHLMQVVAEALGNALRHSGGSRIALRAGVEKQRFVVSISDDGQGFSLHSLPPERRSGLARMQALAEAMKAMLQVETAVGAGTIVTLTIPLEVSAGTYQPSTGGD